VLVTKLMLRGANVLNRHGLTGDADGGDVDVPRK